MQSESIYPQGENKTQDVILKGEFALPVALAFQQCSSHLKATALIVKSAKSRPAISPLALYPVC